MSKGVEEYEPGHAGDIRSVFWERKSLKIVWSGYIPAANQNQTEEYNPEEGTEEDETPSYKPSLAFIEQNYVSCVTSDEKPLADSGYDNTKESSDSDSGKMSSILCVTPLYLRDALTDWDETLRVYRVYPKLLQRHIFNFRSGSQTGNAPPHSW